MGTITKRNKFILTATIVVVAVIIGTFFFMQPNQTAAFARSDVALSGSPIEADAKLPVPEPFIETGLSIKAKPVETPLQLRIPAIELDAAIQGVGTTRKNAMDAPMGKANNPNWREAFWYRGSAIPGELSTALIAGHADDPLGRPGVFAHLDLVIVGDEIVIHDNRTGLDVTFGVTEIKSHTLKETKDLSVLNRMYGTGPIAGLVPQPSDDGLSHLTLITCSGTFSKKQGTHDHRLVIYATRTEEK